VELATGSSSRADLGAALHRLRSTLARLKAELELAEMDAQPPPVENLTRDVAEALRQLGTVEAAVFDITPVVVLDDDARLGELTARGLRRLGYQAEARRGWTARGDGEVIVFDLGLAASLSAEEKEDLRSAGPIVVTGAADPASRALAASFDASDFLIKPVEIDDLAAAVERRMAEERK
jgi:CheY-like chemotaxis protein